MAVATRHIYTTTNRKDVSGGVDVSKIIDKQFVPIQGFLFLLLLTGSIEVYSFLSQGNSTAKIAALNVLNKPGGAMVAPEIQSVIVDLTTASEPGQRDRSDIFFGSNHFKTGTGVDVTMGDGWSSVEEKVIKEKILQVEPILTKFFGLPVASFTNFQIEKKAPEDAARLTRETGWGFYQFPGWTDCREGTGTCIVTLEKAPIGNSQDETVFDHELANAWLSAASTDNPFRQIIDYDKSTEPKTHAWALDYVFSPDRLTFLAQDYIRSQVYGTRVGSEDPFFNSVLQADSTFLAKLRVVLEREAVGRDVRLQLTWKEAINLIHEASPVAGEIFERGRP